MGGIRLNCRATEYASCDGEADHGHQQTFSPRGLAALSTTRSAPPKNPRQAPVSQEERGLWNPKTIVFGGAAM